VHGIRAGRPSSRRSQRPREGASEPRRDADEAPAERSQQALVTYGEANDI
jgi:hypothetical protein